MGTIGTHILSMKPEVTAFDIRSDGGKESIPMDPYMCRICFEETEEVGELIQPCLCRGTQKHVHLKCLRKWQQNVLCNGRNRDGADERAFKCSVCQAPFSTPPILSAWRMRLASFLRGIGGAFCISLLAFGLSGPPWPHLVLMLILLLGTRSHSLLVVAVLLLGSILAALHVRGLRVVMRLDVHGRLGLVLIRHGARVEGVGPGVLLVASEELDHSIFHRSVVLIHQHSALGASGVIVTKELDPSHLLDCPPGDPVRHSAISHFLGGPVGTPRPGAVGTERVILHTVPNVGGAVVVPVNSTPGSSAVPTLFVSQEVEGVVTQLDSGPGAHASSSMLRLYHGISSWAEGQLEGEIRSQSWGYCHATWEDLQTNPEELWGRLSRSPRVRWL